MRVVDGAEALALLKRAVAEKGYGYVYPGSRERNLDGEVTCFYREPSGAPSCIVGHAADYLGILHLLTENVPAGQMLAKHNLPVQFTRKAIRIFDIAQSYQDTGTSWGRAVEKAEKEVLHV